MRVQQGLNLIALFHHAIGDVVGQHVGRLGQVVDGNQLQRGAFGRQRLEGAEIAPLEFLLCAAQRGHTLQHGIAITPTLLAHQAQPDVDEGGTATLAPIIRIQRQRRPAPFIFQRTQPAGGIRATVADHGQHGSAQQLHCRSHGRIGQRQRPQQTEGIRRRGAQQFPARLVVGQTIQLQIEHGQFQRFHHFGHGLRIKRRHLRRHFAVELHPVGLAQRASALFCHRIEQPMTHATPPCPTYSGRRAIGHGR